MRDRAVWLAPVLAGVLTACTVDPAYPLLAAPGASQFSPTALGAPVRGVVLYLEIRPGDTVELVTAEALGVAPGADVATYFSPPITSADGSTLIGQRLEPLEGPRSRSARRPRPARRTRSRSLPRSRLGSPAATA